MLLLPFLFLLGGPSGTSCACLDQASAYRFTGIVCRVTYPAALVLNEKTAQVIQAAFQHARYPDIKGEKSLLFTGRLQYGLHNLEIHNLSIGHSEVELQENEGVGISISNVSATFKGTIKYGYGNWLFSLGQAVDFEVESHISLVINPKLYCGEGKVAADTSDCYLDFHKLTLILQGDREPGWLKRMFTEIVSFTLKMVVKSQICHEINNLANILADFIQERAELFLSDGDIGMDISITSPPLITSNYIESYHKGLVRYNNESAVINASVFSPAHLTDERMLYFWISDDMLNPLVTAAHNDGRFCRNVSGQELTDLFKLDLSAPMPPIVNQLLSSHSSMLRVWSASVPRLWTTPQGTSVRAVAAVELSSGPSDPGTPALYFETEVEVVVRASYAEKRLILKAEPSHVSILKVLLSPGSLQLGEHHMEYLEAAVKKIGIPKVISYLEPGLTTLMDKQGLNLFELINPEVVSRQGYVIVKLDFGFPHHLLVEFLRKTLE
ncbi:cholesteryl ester transfer protein [Megalops cyprinoides]|uniref:cholesteryl ester transfer protein n=1 Tax=Megalops cyprinoides TaxID=118141 RepID=UPI001864013F|nr:cholesteryl ester transfer protein [Megalops cyprinoides]